MLALPRLSLVASNAKAVGREMNTLFELPALRENGPSTQLRALILWPSPRVVRILSYVADRSVCEPMDGLSFLPESGVHPLTLEFSSRMNPWRAFESPLAGLDPIRTLKVLRYYRHFDVIVSVDAPSAFLFVLLKRLLRLNKPVVVIDPPLDENYVNRHRLQRWILPYSERVVVFGHVQQEFLRKVYGDRVKSEFVRHRIDSHFFAPDRRGQSDPAAPYLLSVGNDVSRDFETLISACSGLSCRVIVHTRKTPSGPLPANMELHTEWLTYERLRDLYAGAVAVVVPLRKTIHAGGVNNVLEAMAMGKAIVVSDSPGVADYVEHEKNACVVRTGDAGELRAALERILGDPDLRVKLGRGARHFCEEMCSMPVYARHIAQVLYDVISERDRDRFSVHPEYKGVAGGAQG